MNVLQNDSEQIHIKHLQINERNSLDINVTDFINRDAMTSLLYRSNMVYDQQNRPHILPPIITDDLNEFTKYSKQLRQDLDIYVQSALSEPI